MRLQVSALWSGYSRNVESNPVRTKSATSFVGFVLVRPPRLRAHPPRSPRLPSCMRCPVQKSMRELTRVRAWQGDILAQRLAGESFHFTRCGGLCTRDAMLWRCGRDVWLLLLQGAVSR